MAAKTIILKSIIISTSYLALLLVSLVPISESTSVTGFTTDLIHRDSPLSPLYDPSSTPSQRLINALHRSRHRARRFNNQLEDPQPDLISAGVEYLLNFSIGTPPVPTLAIADTGSDIVWTQCQPCTQCFKQRLPLFNPQNSASYAGVPCGSTTCNSLPETDCTTAGRNCSFSTRYGDGSYTKGVFATESFTFASAGAGGKTVLIPNIVFGCASLANGISTGIDSGIVGLGGGGASLVSQLGQGKFSYCLVPQFQDDITSSGKLSFGSEAEVSGGEVVSTPLAVKPGKKTYYFMTMEGISVGEKRIEFFDDSSSSYWRSVREGNIIIDSGTPVTRLPSSLFAEVAMAIKSQIKLKEITHPNLLCFETGGDIRAFPKIRVHLRGGDLIWGFENAFAFKGKDSACLVALADDGVPIYGNIAQANFLVGYDLVKRTVSFKPAHCGV